jgi:hypothetical protein
MAIIVLSYQNPEEKETRITNGFAVCARADEKEIDRRAAAD